VVIAVDKQNTRMTKFNFIFLLLLSGHLFGQNTQTDKVSKDTLKSFQLIYTVSNLHNCTTITTLNDPGNMTVKMYCNEDKKPIYNKKITVNKESFLSIKNTIVNYHKILSFPDTINGAGYDGYSFKLVVIYNGKTKTIKGTNPKLETFEGFQDYIHHVVGITETGPY
jgi:hypothetical protein